MSENPILFSVQNKEQGPQQQLRMRKEVLGEQEEIRPLSVLQNKRTWKAVISSSLVGLWEDRKHECPGNFL